MPTKGELIKEAVTKASQAMDADPKLKGTAAVAKFMALYHRLIARRRGRLASNLRRGHNKKLLAPQDDALKDYIFMLYVAKTLANLKVIQNAAKQLLYYAFGNNKLVSRRWTKAWIARHSDYFKTLKTKPIICETIKHTL
jgi:hypothetical protein